MKINSEKILNAVGDRRLRDIVRESARSTGAPLNDAGINQVVNDGVKAGIRKACRSVWGSGQGQSYREIQQMIDRSTRKFFAQIGVRGHQNL